MKKIFVFISIAFLPGIGFAQADTVRKITTDIRKQGTDSVLREGYVVVNKDSRIEFLSKKLGQYYDVLSSKTAPSSSGYRNVPGYRLQIMNSNDRNLVMKVRQKLLQTFPDQQLRVLFQAPFIKLKFGDFLDKGEAERYKKQIVAMHIVPNNVYVTPETVTIRVGREKQDDDPVQ